MFNSTFSNMIANAVNDCIQYGKGRETTSLCTGDKFNTVTVRADWANDEESIEVAVYENQVLRFYYVERIPEEYR